MSIIDTIKLIGNMGVPFRGPRDDSNINLMLESQQIIQGLVISLNSSVLKFHKKPNLGASFEDL